MSPRGKSILLLLATLAIGIVLGALLNARLADHRIQRIESLRSQRGFTRYIERAIEPQDEAQREAVRDILQQSGERMNMHMRQSREQVRSILDSTRLALDSVLTDEQMEQLDRRLEERRRDGRPSRGRRGPPPSERVRPDTVSGGAGDRSPTDLN